MARYIAAYDVSRDSIRQRVAAVLAEYGVRLQLSLFEVELDPEDLPEFRRRVGSLLARTDRFDLIPVDTRPDRARLVWQHASSSTGAVVFI